MSIESKAAGETYVSPFCEPSTSINQGYINVIYAFPNGAKQLQTVCWSAVPLNSASSDNTVSEGTATTATAVDVSVYNSSIIFSTKQRDLDYMNFSIYSLTNTGQIFIRHQSVVSGYGTYTLDFGSAKIYSYQVFGNVGAVNHALSNYTGDSFQIVWSDDAPAYNVLVQILASMNKSTTNLKEVMEAQNSLQEEANQLQKEQNETSKGIFGSIKEFFGSFFDNLIESIIGIFVPGSEEMSSLFDRLNEFFSDTFGFLYYPFEFIIEAFGIFTSADSETAFALPSFSIMGCQVWGEQTYDIASNEIANTVFTYVRIGTGAILSLAFVNYLRSFFEKRFGGGGN